MSLKNILFAAVLTGAALAPASASATDILYGSYVGPNHGHNKYGLSRFFKVATEKAPSLNFTLSPGGAIVGAKTTLAGIRDGVVDAGLVVSLYHPDDLPYNSVITDLALWSDSAAVSAAAANETTLLDCPGCMAEWEKWNIKHFGAYAATPYAILCAEPVKTLDDLKGKKIRGAGAFGRWITALGATPVNVAITEVYEGLQRGQIDCTLGSIGMMKSFSFADVAKYILEVPSGAYIGGSMININLDKWKTLTDEEKRAYIYAAPAGVRGSTIDGYVGDDRRAAAKFDEQGITTFKPDQAVLEALQKHRQSEIETVAEVARKRGVKNPEKIVQSFLDNLKKWEKIMAEIGDDPDKYEEALRREIYSKVTF